MSLGPLFDAGVAAGVKVGRSEVEERIGRLEAAVRAVVEDKRALMEGTLTDFARGESAKIVGWIVDPKVMAELEALLYG